MVLPYSNSNYGADSYSAGTGVTINGSNEISIGQSVGTSDSVTLAGLNINGTVVTDDLLCNGDAAAQRFSAKELTVKHPSSAQGVNVREGVNSGFTNVVLEIMDPHAELNESVDFYANLAVREVYVYNPTTSDPQGSAITALIDNAQGDAENALTLAETNETAIATLTASGTVAQMKYHQTRARKEDANGNHVGYLLFTAGDSTINDVHIDLMDISITPKAAGNAILCQWNINYNITGETGDYIFFVKRNNGTSSTTLPFSEDSVGDYWTGVSLQYEHSSSNRGTNLEIKIVDESCLATTTTYELYVRCTDLDGVTTNFFLNHPPPPNEIGDITNNTSTHEGTLSLATLTEIRA